jgi:hypothetical protein
VLVPFVGAQASSLLDAQNRCWVARAWGANRRVCVWWWWWGGVAKFQFVSNDDWREGDHGALLRVQQWGWGGVGLVMSTCVPNPCCVVG